MALSAWIAILRVCKYVHACVVHVSLNKDTLEFLLLLLFALCFETKSSFYSPGWPGICYIY